MRLRFHFFPALFWPGDKVVINIVAVSLLWTPAAAIPLPVVSLWLSKDLLLVVGTVLRLQQHRHPMEESSLIQATAISKINTGLQFATLAVAITQTLTTTTESLFLMPLCYLTSCTTVASIFSYRHQAFPGLFSGVVPSHQQQGCSAGR
jgi:phosphatidylglycerophosphate synthase